MISLKYSYRIFLNMWISGVKELQRKSIIEELEPKEHK